VEADRKEEVKLQEEKLQTLAGKICELGYSLDCSLWYGHWIFLSMN